MGRRICACGADADASERYLRHAGYFGRFVRHRRAGGDAGDLEDADAGDFALVASRRLIGGFGELRGAGEWGFCEGDLREMCGGERDGSWRRSYGVWGADGRPSDGWESLLA